MVKAIKTIWNVLSTLILLVIVVLAVLLAGVRLVGLRPFVVLSGSMEPTYHVGAMIYVKSVDPGSIQVGDPITFVLNEDLDVATRVSIQLQLTAPDLKSRDRVVKKSEKDSLYAAMDIAAIWLERALAGKEK